MSNIAVKVDGLSKQYRIGGRQESYKTLRDTITDAATSPFKRARSLLKGQAYGAAGLEETIWALKDISFEVNHGEVVGIIGPNGAGKSTLLKILSRITEPTEGYAKVYGRVGSLLEVGTGFHPELTGRENIYLNGAILGMGRAEIDRKFAEIVDFAGIERFIDTPVKYYSSGMGLRLGFAVAAHLEPEILVVDEVLAVGDAAFQKKCLGKMGDVANEGRTVLFVSHNMAAISALCSHSIMLKNGQIQMLGVTDKVLKNYLSDVITADPSSLASRKDRQGSGRVRLTNVTIVSSNSSPVVSGDSAYIMIDYETRDNAPVEDLVISCKIKNYLGQNMFACSTQLQGLPLYHAPSKGRLVCSIARFPLMSGSYRLNLWCSVKGQTADFVEDAILFTVLEGDFFGTGKLPTKQKHGEFLVDHTWELHETISLNSNDAI